MWSVRPNINAMLSESEASKTYKCPYEYTVVMEFNMKAQKSVLLSWKNGYIEYLKAL